MAGAGESAQPLCSDSLGPHTRRPITERIAGRELAAYLEELGRSGPRARADRQARSRPRRGALAGAAARRGRRAEWLASEIGQLGSRHAALKLRRALERDMNPETGVS